MAKGDLPGAFEQLILLALLRLGSDAYGMTVRQEIEARTGRSVSLRLESSGRLALTQALEAVDQMRAGAPHIIPEPGT
jgi:hypothetical protein